MHSSTPLTSVTFWVYMKIWFSFRKQVDFGREVPLFEVEATAVEPEFDKLYSYLFDIENGGYPIEEIDRPRPTAIFVVNFDKVSSSVSQYFLYIF